MNSIDAQLDQDSDVTAMIAAIWEGKWVVAIATGLAMLGALIVVMIVDPVYEAEVVAAHNVNSGATDGLPRTLGSMERLAAISGLGLNSAQGDQEIALATLRSRRFTAQFMERFQVKAALFPDLWDPDTNKWRVSEGAIPTDWSAYNFWAKDVFQVSEDSATGLVHIRIHWQDPMVAARWANEIIVMANAVLQQQALAQSERNLSYLAEQMTSSRIEEIRAAIAGLIQQETASMMVASGNQDFAFRIIDPAVPAEDPYFPRPLLLVFSATVLGFLLGVLAALIRAYTKGRSLLTSPPPK